jgi:hypothetical protein
MNSIYPGLLFTQFGLSGPSSAKEVKNLERLHKDGKKKIVVSATYSNIEGFSFGVIYMYPPVYV